ncbi:MAG: hypothetical protein SVO01_13560 [Thermotogota bacterium]|nr:hypothetical protein [Thermotogota bacterium]
MKDITLTKSLKENKAIVLKNGADCPEGFIEISGAFLPEGEISIAVPAKLYKQTALITKLSDEAANCIAQSMNP